MYIKEINKKKKNIKTQKTAVNGKDCDVLKVPACAKDSRFTR